MVCHRLSRDPLGSGNAGLRRSSEVRVPQYEDDSARCRCDSRLRHRPSLEGLQRRAREAALEQGPTLANSGSRLSPASEALGHCTFVVREFGNLGRNRNPERRLGAFLSIAILHWDFSQVIGSCRPQILYWRLVPFPFTGRGWKLRSSSHRRIWCLEKRTFDSIRRYGMNTPISSITMIQRSCSCHMRWMVRLADSPRTQGKSASDQGGVLEADTKICQPKWQAPETWRVWADGMLSTVGKRREERRPRQLRSLVTGGTD
jgi:hypothetical protein